MICAFTSSCSCCCVTAFTLPTVPTGIKMGVRISPWSVVIFPALAFEAGSVCCRSNCNAGINYYFCFMNFTQTGQILFYVFCLLTLVQLFYYLFFFTRLAVYKPKPRPTSQTHPVSVI